MTQVILLRVFMSLSHCPFNILIAWGKKLSLNVLCGRSCSGSVYQRGVMTRGDGLDD